MLPAAGNGMHWDLELKGQAKELLNQLTSLLSSEFRALCAQLA
jgi:hypothetical protein